MENRRKIQPKEIPSCMIPRLLVVFTWQLKIVLTTLGTEASIIFFWINLLSNIISGWVGHRLGFLVS